MWKSGSRGSDLTASPIAQVKLLREYDALLGIMNRLKGQGYNQVNAEQVHLSTPSSGEPGIS